MFVDPSIVRLVFRSRSSKVFRLAEVKVIFLKVVAFMRRQTSVFRFRIFYLIHFGGESVQMKVY